MKKLQISQLHLIIIMINIIYSYHKNPVSINFIDKSAKKAVIIAFIYIFCIEYGLYYNK